MEITEELRIKNHPILQEPEVQKEVTIFYNGEPVKAYEGEPISAALMAAGIRTFRRTVRRNEPRGVFCAIGRCTDCMMVVDGRPNTRTCMTMVQDGMRIEPQFGFGK